MRGFVTISSARDNKGRVLPLNTLVKEGWVVPAGETGDWDIPRTELPLGRNMFVDQGRQLLAYAFGGRSPSSDYILRKFGAGTGTNPTTRLDTHLDSPVLLGAAYTKDLDTVDFPAPFIVRAFLTLAAGEANGYLLTEFGLFSGNDALVARELSGGINKTEDWSPTLSWRLRV